MRNLFLSTLLLLVCSCGGDSEDSDASFSLRLAPSLVQSIIPGQRVAILVELDEDETEEGAVRLEASIDGAEVEVSPSNIRMGEVSEVSVTAHEDSIDRTLELRVIGLRGGESSLASIALNVVAGDVEEYKNSLEPRAAEIRDRFVQWLSANQPALGINAETAWSGEVVSPYILVVSHYLFFSEEWEMLVSWHVMIPPDDWATVYLRRRTSNFAPSHAFKIDSIDDPESEPHADEVPEEIWR